MEEKKSYFIPEHKNIYFTSDLHINDPAVIFKSQRPFKDVMEMNATLIKNWNNKVTNDDIVFILGDFGDYNFLNKLNGIKYLIMGNYERDDIDYKELKSYESDTVTIINEKIFILEENNFKLLMTHEPSNYNYYYEELLKYTPDKCIRLFGHIHKLCMIKRNGLNVGTDCHNFTPIGIDTIKFYKNAIDNYYDNNVFNDI